MFEDRLNELKAQSLYRSLKSSDHALFPFVTMDGVSYLNFGSNNYLGLATHPSVVEAMKQALDVYGAGATASRYVCGNLDVHDKLEKRIASWIGQEEVLLTSSGYLANLGCLQAVLGAGDYVFFDRSCHASLMDGFRLSLAKCRSYRHNDLEDLEQKLCLFRAKDGLSSVWIVTESLFSMDGDSPDLVLLHALAEKYDAKIIIDEAHALGVLGSLGSGLVSSLERSERVALVVGTLGKSLGVSGGFIAGSKNLMDWVRNKARTSIYTTGMPPVVAAGVLCALELTGSSYGDEARSRLRALCDLFRPFFANGQTSHVVPWIVGDSDRAIALSEHLKGLGLWVPVMRYPTVKRGQERLRISLTSAHRLEDVSFLIRSIAD